MFFLVLVCVFVHTNMYVRACMGTCVCVCVRVCPCMFVSVCAFVFVGVCAKVCMYFGGYGGKENQDYAVMPSFYGSVVFAECLPRVHNDY